MVTLAVAATMGLLAAETGVARGKGSLSASRMVSNFLPAVVLLDRRRERAPPWRGCSEEELFKEELFMRALLDFDFRTTGVFTLTGVGVSTTSSFIDGARRLLEGGGFPEGFPERPSMSPHVNAEVTTLSAR